MSEVDVTVFVEVYLLVASDCVLSRIAEIGGIVQR